MIGWIPESLNSWDRWASIMTLFKRISFIEHTHSL